MKRFFLFVLLFVAFFVAAGSAQAVSLDARGLGRYDAAAGLLVVEGWVEVTVGDMVISADSLRWDLNSEDLLFQGRVKVREGSNILEGDAFAYNRLSGRGQMTEVFSRISLDAAEGPLFVIGEELAFDAEGYVVTEAKITTCDLSEPHFHIAVRSLEVIPNDRLIIRGVVYYEGRIPLFYWPYLVIPIRDELQNQLALPRIGYNTEQGWYIKNTYAYYLSRAAFGFLYLDIYSRAGLGLGFRHNYLLAGAGFLSFYALPSQGERTLTWRHEWETGNWYGSIDHRTQQTLTAGETSSASTTAAAAYYRGTSLRMDAQGSYQTTSGRDRGDLRLTGKGTYVFSRSLTLNTDISYTDRPTARVPRTVDYTVRLQYREGVHRGTALLQQRYNPDLNKDDVRPNWRSVNRLPELTYSYNGWSLARIEVGLGNYTEFPQETQHWRGTLTLEPTRRTYSLWQGALLSTGSTVTGNFYPGAGSRLLLNNQLQWRQTLSPSVTLTAAYNRQDIFGATPFAFDVQQEQSALAVQGGYYTPRLSFSVQTGYDFVTETYQNVVAHLRQRPSAALRWDVYAYYDLNLREMGTIAATLNYRPDVDWNLSLGARYSVSESQWERLDAGLAVPLGERLQLEIDAIYQPDRSRWARAGVGLTWDLHCRELTLRYDHVESEVWLEYRLNAFPTLPVTIGTGDRTSLFDLDDIQDILGIPDEAR